MKTNLIIAATAVSSNMSKIRVVAVGAMVVLGLIAGFGPMHQIAQAGPAAGGGH